MAEQDSSCTCKPEERQHPIWHDRRGPTEHRAGGDDRDCFQRDLARVIHSAAFRRLQAKTQVLGIGEGDFHRTRLTHSIETAQIGTGIVAALRRKEMENKKVQEALPTSDLIRCICLAHDLGHPPFGHAGEIALNYCMRNDGGFEGNGQTLRLLTWLESHTEGHGVNLTRRSLLGVLKYPVNYRKLRKKKYPRKSPMEASAEHWAPAKCYHDDEQEVVEWILKPFGSEKKQFQKLELAPRPGKHGKPKYKALDTTILDLADDIAYGAHDLEDGIRLGLIGADKLFKAIGGFDKKWKKNFRLQTIKKEDLFVPGIDSWKRTRAIGALIHAFIHSAIIIKRRNFTAPFLKYQAALPGEVGAALEALKTLVEDDVIRRPEVQTLEYRGQSMIIQLFKAFQSDPERLLKGNFAEDWRRAQSEQKKMRVICDYISGMTDEYATKMYERLFMPREGTVFQKL